MARQWDYFDSISIYATTPRSSRISLLGLSYRVLISSWLDKYLVTPNVRSTEGVATEGSRRTRASVSKDLLGCCFIPAPRIGLYLCSPKPACIRLHRAADPTHHRCAALSPSKSREAKWKGRANLLHVPHTNRPEIGQVVLLFRLRVEYHQRLFRIRSS